MSTQYGWTIQIIESQTIIKLWISALLEDALAQLRSNHKVSVVTTIPDGLLGSTHGTELWKPPLYLLKTAIKKAAQIYRPITRPFNHVSITNNGMIRLRSTSTGYFALSSMADDCEDQLSRYPIKFMFNRMKRIAGLWPPRDMHEKCRITLSNKHVAKRMSNWKELAICARSVGKSISMAVSSFTQGRKEISKDMREGNSIRY